MSECLSGIHMKFCYLVHNRAVEGHGVHRNEQSHYIKVMEFHE